MGCNASKENIARPKAVPWDMLDDLHSDFDPMEYVSNLQRKKKRQDSNGIRERNNEVSIPSSKEYHKMRKNRSKRGVGHNFDTDSDSNTSYSRTIKTITVDLSKEDNDYCSNLLPPKIIYSPKAYSSTFQNIKNEDHVSNHQGSRRNKNNSKRNGESDEWNECDNIQEILSDLRGSLSVEQIPISTRRKSRKPPKSQSRKDGATELYFSRPKLRFASSLAPSTSIDRRVSSFPGSEESTHNRMFQIFQDSERQLKRSLL
eukprot:CAMPEP_0116137274 /NCGR_PEP_ID=MMETSP0329-20121206/12165_1 /TAXON_ID=697910 /ORGANISM="Pseudo-nitzschia arenysensis, Strain B593" /LENGTH=258 /DNA_ID=CAMNT_0003632187 /DNA_START=93 /DNA_END=869 /DNA_ORIENTATION=+